jgi:hypothetical protein
MINDATAASCLLSFFNNNSRGPQKNPGKRTPSPPLVVAQPEPRAHSPSTARAPTRRSARGSHQGRESRVYPTRQHSSNFVCSSNKNRRLVCAFGGRCCSREESARLTAAVVGHHGCSRPASARRRPPARAAERRVRLVRALARVEDPARPYPRARSRDAARRRGRRQRRQGLARAAAGGGGGGARGGGRAAIAALPGVARSIACVDLTPY